MRSTPWKQTLEDGTEVVRTCAWSPPGCHPVGCGLKLFVKDGKLVKVEGDPEHPITKGKLCVRCLTLPEYVNHPDRIIYPMRRDPKDRGKNKWERISWDEAIKLAADQIKQARDKYGYEGTTYFMGTGREAGHYNGVMDLACLETPNACYAFSGWSCYGPRIATTAFVLGAGIPEIDYAGGFEDRYDDPNFVLPKYIMLWGKAPLESNPDGLWGHVVVEMMKRGSKVITIDPRMTWLASRAAYAVRLRPGTDAALGLGFLNVIINENLYDHEFVEKYTSGFEELAERVQEYPPAKVAEITGVPEEQIIEVARVLATERPNSCSWGLAVDTNANGVQIGQIILTISAITGNLDIPGGTVIGVANPGLVEAIIDDSLPEGVLEKRIGAEKYPAVSMTLRFTQPDEFLETLETDKPYPVRMAWIGSSNFLSPTCSAQPERWMKALQKMEFTMATDLFMTPTTMALADLFLPVSTFAEHKGVVFNHYGANTAFVGAINPAITVGECKSDIEISFLLGKELHPDRFSMTVDEFYERQLDGYGLSHQELRDLGTIQVPTVYRKYEKGLLRPDGQPGFNTSSGKFEIHCSMFEAFGDDPIPYYMEPKLSPVSTPELAKEYPLIFTSGARKFTSFHSEHRQIKSLRAIDPDPILEIHPKTAEKLDIKDGDWVTVENHLGKAQLKALLTPIIHPDTVHCQHGWWFPEEDGEAPNLFGTFKSNINSLIPHHDNGALGFGAPFKNVICKVYKSN